MDKPKETKWVKVQIPEGLGAISHEGITYVAVGHTTDVPDSIVEALIAKGCKLAADEQFPQSDLNV